MIQDILSQTETIWPTCMCFMEDWMLYISKNYKHSLYALIAVCKLYRNLYCLTDEIFGHCLWISKGVSMLLACCFI